MNLLINGRRYGYTIEPYYNKVRVEIYKVEEIKIIDTLKEVNIHLLDKSFGKWYYIKPVKEDYEKAKKWAERQMKLIEIANS